MNEKRWPQYSENDYIRVCQECGYAQKSRDPILYRDESWRELKCKKCQSRSLDFGQHNYYEDEK